MWEKLQQEVSAWALHNFGKQGAWQPTLGLIEECGEFMAAREQLHSLVYRGMSKPDYEIRAAMQDAIADQCIYACNLCEITDISLGNIAKNALQGGLTDAQILGALAAACHAVLKFEQGIRGVDSGVRREKLTVALSLWFSWASTQCHRFNLGDIADCTQKVWAEVSKRDWKKNPVSANVDASQKQTES